MVGSPDEEDDPDAWADRADEPMPADEQPDDPDNWWEIRREYWCEFRWD